MSTEPKVAKDPAGENRADPEALLQDGGVTIAKAPQMIVARADGRVWIDLRAERERLRMLEELFNVALGRDPSSTKSLIDQTTATPKVTKVREAAHRMAKRMAERGFEITGRRG